MTEKPFKDEDVLWTLQRPYDHPMTMEYVLVNRGGNVVAYKLQSIETGDSPSWFGPCYVESVIVELVRQLQAAKSAQEKPRAKRQSRCKSEEDGL